MCFYLNSSCNWYRNLLDFRPIGAEQMKSFALLLVTVHGTVIDSRNGKHLILSMMRILDFQMVMVLTMPFPIMTRITRCTFDVLQTRYFVLIPEHAQGPVVKLHPEIHP